MRRLTLLVFFFVIFFISCSTGDVPFEHRYVIDVVLKPNKKIQKAFIDSTYRLDVPVSAYYTGISGAEIFIVNENSDTFRYSESGTNMGIYFSDDSFCVEYGMEYSVNVSVEGEEISKEVQVPDSLTIFSPGFSDTIFLSNPPLLIWNSCENSYDSTYMVTAQVMGNTEDFIPMLTPDTIMGVFYNEFLFEETDTMYTVYVEAMDSNAYTFLMAWSHYDELNDNGSVIGLIGAVVYDSVRVWVTE
jgi:hypothetical protein